MVLVASLLFLAVGWALGLKIELRRQQAAKMAADDIRSEAEREAEAIKKERLREAADHIQKLEIEARHEIEKNQAAQQLAQERLKQAENALEAKEGRCEEREKRLVEREKHLEAKEERILQSEDQLARKQEEFSKAEASLREALERQAGLTKEEAQKLYKLLYKFLEESEC